MPDAHPSSPLSSFPPPERWDDWTELDAQAWPKRVERRYSLVPTICFNCEAACGLVAYVDKDTKEIRKLEGNPHHPGSRGRNCAKGPATLGQVHDPSRILHPMKRVGPRGSGRFERATWDEALDAIAGAIRAALLEGRHDEIMYHVGRPGEDHFTNRVLQSWGVDAHNSHTNVCSASARFGYTLWSGTDRPSPDHEHAKFILLLSAHLETGHYFNPHAQRIVDGQASGAKICAIDVRLSNTASRADWWLSPLPGTEPMLLLAFAKVLLDEGLYDRDFVETWTNWRACLEFLAPGTPPTFEAFIAALRAHYAFATPDAAAAECDVPAERIVEIARAIGAARGGLATHVWRNAAAGNLGGWQVARCLQLLVVLTGSLSTRGGTAMNAHNKFVPAPFRKPPPQSRWNELLYPKEYPLAFFELSFLLPHFLLEGRGRVAAYFTRVYNPVWTNPDGLLWERVLTDESLVGLHAALTPTWNESAQYADWVLPMGHGPERHDLMSTETHAAQWIGWRQPVTRVARERAGERFDDTRGANPGEVWEEAEFWTELSWRIDPDGALGIRRYFESPHRPGAKITMDEYFGWIFENSVPGLPEAAAAAGLDPLEYMKTHGAFLVKDGCYEPYKAPLAADAAAGATTDADGTVRRDGKAIGVAAEGTPRAGFATPSRRLEIFSPTMVEWGWPEHALPGYIRSHVHRDNLDRAAGEMPLIPTFRLPTLIHTRSANAKWLYELSNSNPVWMHPDEARRLGVETGDLVKVRTRIGHFVNRAWVTDGIRPGIVACSHHLGRWRLFDDAGTERWASAKVRRETLDGGVVRWRRTEDLGPWTSGDPDSKRVWWTDGGVHQNMTFPVQPDPLSGQHCWHQAVRVEKAGPDDRYGDVVVDPEKSMAVYREWLALTRPAPGPGNLRRPLWLPRAVRPSDEAYVCRPEA